MPATQAQVMNSLASDRRRMSDDALMWSDVEDALRDCEDKVAALLKACEADAAYFIFQQLEELKGIAGKKQMENE